MVASGCKSNTSAAPIDREKLHGELQELRAQREKVIEERKQCDVELKGLNVQVQKKVGCIFHLKPRIPQPQYVY